jgi:ribulose-phosphate 3-epimerase
MTRVKISPSILAADFAHLGDAIKAVEAAGADYIHIDVMDGDFVPNITIGPCVIQSLRRITTLPFDVHLMVTKPERFIDDFANAGADIITIHPEATPHAHRALQQIRQLGKKPGISLNPATPIAISDYLIDMVDLILVMSVNPGFGGQKFIPSQLQKITELRTKIKASQRTIELEVDGGINMQTAQAVIAAGADVLVAGTAIFGQPINQYGAIMQGLRG